MKNPIIVIDSGVGGTHILAQCALLMPHQDFVYFSLLDLIAIPTATAKPPQRPTQAIAIITIAAVLILVYLLISDFFQISVAFFTF